jgi:hypothetical protein
MEEMIEGDIMIALGPDLPEETIDITEGVIVVTTVIVEEEVTVIVIEEIAEIDMIVAIMVAVGITIIETILDIETEIDIERRKEKEIIIEAEVIVVIEPEVADPEVMKEEIETHLQKPNIEDTKSLSKIFPGLLVGSNSRMHLENMVQSAVLMFLKMKQVNPRDMVSYDSKRKAMLMLQSIAWIMLYLMAAKLVFECVTTELNKFFNCSKPNFVFVE